MGVRGDGVYGLTAGPPGSLCPAIFSLRKGPQATQQERLGR